MVHQNILIKDITLDHVGKTYSFVVRIQEIYQTGGPTIFTLNDGTALLRSAKFNGAGVRAYPDLKEGDVLHATVKLYERDGRMESEFLSYTPVDAKGREAFDRMLEEVEAKQYQPEVHTFLVPSKILEDLRPLYVRAVFLIKKAIAQGRPILVRHHADCDGYCSAVALERAILPRLEEQYGRDAWKYFKRSASKAPYYSYSDALKDVSGALGEHINYNRLMPLIISVDNGSTQEDLLGFKKAKIHGAQLMVVDHHNPGPVHNGKVAVDEVLDGHINPYLVGHDNRLCTGMLCVELARMLNKNVKDIYHLASVAGVGDMCAGAECDGYMAISNKEGFDKEYLQKMSSALNWEAFHAGFSETKHLMTILLGKRTKEQEEMVNLSHSTILAERARHLESLKQYLQEEIRGDIVTAFVDIENVSQWGDYFSSGKMSSLAFGYLREKHAGKKVIVFGHGPTFITLRAEKGILDTQTQKPMSLPALVHELSELYPHACIEGGGHEIAGTIRFVSAAQKDVLAHVKAFAHRLK